MTHITKFILFFFYFLKATTQKLYIHNDVSLLLWSSCHTTILFSVQIFSILVNHYKLEYRIKYFNHKFYVRMVVFIVVLYYLLVPADLHAAIAHQHYCFGNRTRPIAEKLIGTRLFTEYKCYQRHWRYLISNLWNIIPTFLIQACFITNVILWKTWLSYIKGYQFIG